MRGMLGGITVIWRFVDLGRFQIRYGVVVVVVVVVPAVRMAVVRPAVLEYEDSHQIYDEPQNWIRQKHTREEVKV